MKRTLISACLLVVGVVAWPTAEARAEVHVDFLFGNGYGYGPYHHHHHPHYRYYADYYWYAPPPVRYVPVAPAPVVYVPTPVSVAAPVAQPMALQTPNLAPTQTTTTQTVTTQVQSPAAPNLRTNSVPSSAPSLTREASNSVRETVVVSNPAGSGGQVSFIVDGKREVTLGAGERTTLSDAGNYVVEFDRGESYGTTRIVLEQGTYEFAVTASGWDLQRRSSVAGSDTFKPVVRRNSLPTQR